MKNNQELYRERLERVRKAISLEKPDRTPFGSYIDAFYAKMLGIKIAEFIDIDKSHQVMMEGTQWLNELDAVSGTYNMASAASAVFLSRVKLPGRELPEDSLWQIDEQELMTPEDYDEILSKGPQAFSQEYAMTRLNADFSTFGEIMTKGPVFDQNMRDAGFPLYYSAGTIGHPVDSLCGGRTLAKFLIDIRRMPEKVAEVMQVMTQANIEQYKATSALAVDPLTVFIAMGRGAPDFMSPKLWEAYIWKFLKQMTDAVIESGNIANFHADANWTRGLDYLKEFPRGTCVFETDGTTDIYLAREKLGDKMCIKGDVQAAKLAVATPDEVYSYSSQLVRDMGHGFILSSGCGIPPNAKPENVKAMAAAITGK